MILIKIPESYFVDFDKLVPKFIWSNKRPRVANTILNNKVGLTLPEFKTYCKANQDSVELVKEYKNRSWDRFESPEIDPQKYNPLIFDKEQR